MYDISRAEIRKNCERKGELRKEVLKQQATSSLYTFYFDEYSAKKLSILRLMANAMFSTVNCKNAMFKIIRTGNDSEALQSSVVQSLLQYFHNHKKHPANFGIHSSEKQHTMPKPTSEARSCDKQILALLRHCFSSPYRPLFEQSWRKFVHKLKQSLDVALEKERVCGESPQTSKLLLLFSIVERANGFIPNIIHKRLAEDLATGWHHPFDIRDESALQCECVAPANEFVSGTLSLRFEKHHRARKWMSHIMDEHPHLFPFEAKTWLLHQRLYRKYDAEVLKIKINRQNLIPSAEFFFDVSCSEPQQKMFVLFEGENGVGRGPTIEFFTLLSHELRQHHDMWRRSNALFPRPYHPSCSNDDVISKFRLLGRFMAKALREDTLLDMPLSRAFYKTAFLEEDLGIDEILEFDPVLGWHLLELQAIANLNKKGKVLTYNYRGCNIQDLGLCFRLPGYEDYSLTSECSSSPSPADDADVLVTSSNLKEYVHRIVKATLVEGVKKQIEAFRRGFNDIIELWQLRIFSAKELELLLCGEGHGQTWSRETLEKLITFEFQFADKSDLADEREKKFKENVIGILSEFDEEERKRFLLFVTGSSRLPAGVFKAAHHYITVLGGPGGGDGGDVALPGAMTCSRTLRISDYNGQKHVMKAKLSYAITHGCGSFDYV